MDINTEGHQCIAGKFRSSSLFHLLECRLNIPSEKEIYGIHFKIPFALVRDGGYLLMNCLI